MCTRIRTVILYVFLLMASFGAVSFPVPAAADGYDAEAEETAEPAGRLVREDGKYRYYEDGKAVKNRWVTVDGRRYHFGKDGSAAVFASKIKGRYYVFDSKGRLMCPDIRQIVSVKAGGETKKYQVDPDGTAASGWAEDKTYYFYETGEAATGYAVVKDKFFYFNANGRYAAAKTKKVRKAAKYEKPFAELQKLIGKPEKSRYAPSCYGKGKDGMLKYSRFIVYTFKPDRGTEIFMGVDIQ